MRTAEICAVIYSFCQLWKVCQLGARNWSFLGRSFETKFSASLNTVCFSLSNQKLKQKNAPPVLKGECAIQNESFHKKFVIKQKRTAYAKTRQLTCPNWFAICISVWELYRVTWLSEEMWNVLLECLFAPEASISMDIYVFLRFPTHITGIK